MEHISKELNIGRAGEYIALADLILQGEKAFLTDQGMNYDLVVDKNGKMIRLQVKTTQKLKTKRGKKEYKPTYFFHIRRAGKGAKRQFEIGEFEGFALVALDIKQVFYLLFDERIATASISLRDKKIKYQNSGGKGRRYLYYQDLTWENFLKDYERFSGQIAKNR